MSVQWLQDAACILINHVSKMLDPKAIQNQFFRVAKSYDAASSLQRQVAEELIDRVELVRPTEEFLLDLGSATGHLGRSAKEKFPNMSIVEIDLSLAMAVESSTANASATTLVSSAEMLALSTESAPLVVSNMLLHWCDLGSVLAEVSRVLQVGGSFLFSTLGPDSLFEMRSAWAEVDTFAHVHDFLDMHNLGDALITAGFSEPVLDTDHFCVTYDEFLDLILSLRRMGATNARNDRRRTLTGKKRYQRAVDTYESFRNKDGKLPITYEVVYGLATKAHHWSGSSFPVVTRTEER